VAAAGVGSRLTIVAIHGRRRAAIGGVGVVVGVVGSGGGPSGVFAYASVHWRPHANVIPSGHKDAIGRAASCVDVGVVAAVGASSRLAVAPDASGKRLHLMMLVSL
jgi:hypothetical protein